MKISLKITAATLALLALTLTPHHRANALVSAGGSIFEQGKVNVSLTGGLGYAFNNNYAVLGTGINYFIVNGLSAGVDAEAWLGNNPNFYKVSPQVRYFFYKHARTKPYVGVFYRRTFYEGLDDLDSFGGRIGLYSRLSRNAWGGIGLVGEKYLSCNDRDYSSCSTIYPEFSVAMGF